MDDTNRGEIGTRSPDTDRALRERAESRLRRAGGPLELRGETPERVAHELRVYQAELELQNEELRRWELELSASRAEYASLYDEAPVGYFSFDRHGRILRANLTAAAMLRMGRADLIGLQFARFLDVASADTFYLQCQAAGRTHQKQACELRVLPAAGQPLTCRLDSICVDKEGQQVCHSTMVDRTAQKRVELALQESEARLRQIAEHVADVFWIVERELQRVSYVSPGFERVWGHPAEPVAAGALAWTQWVHETDRSRAHTDAMHLWEGQPLDAEYRIANAGQKPCFVRVRAFAVESAQGDVARHIFVAQDVTAERALQQELQQVLKMEAMGALASGMAHDSRNVLQAVIGCMRIAMSDAGLSERSREHLTRGIEAAKSGARLTDQLMAFGRKELLRPRPIRIDELLERTAPLLQRLLGDTVAVRLQLDGQGAVIEADPVQIEQILLNLGSNARDAMPQGGTLTVSSEHVDIDPLHAARIQLSSHGPHVRLRVADTGCGMDDDTQKRVFELFFTTKGEGRGTGLGLATVLAVTHKLHGQVAVESEVGKGTAFTLLLPLTDEVPSRPLTSESTDKSKLQGRVLLVEDNDAVRTVLAEQMRELGLEVTESASGPEALALCEAQGSLPDALVSDVMMPSMTGFELAERLRRQQPQLPVLYLSAYAPEDLVRTGSRPVATILRKPVDGLELQQELRSLLASAERAEPVATSGGPRTVLLVEDEVASRLVLRDFLEDEGFTVLHAATAAAALKAANHHASSIDVLLTDLNLPDLRGPELANTLRQALPALKVVYMSGEVEADVGADTLLPKPLDLDAVAAAVS